MAKAGGMILRRIRKLNKEEFITRLQHSLAGALPGVQVAEHVRYYREYIDSEIRKGRGEAEVLAQLGDPRLLAKSMIEAGKAGTANGSAQGYEEEMAEDVQDAGYDRTGRVRRVMLPGWMMLLILVMVVLIVIGLVGSVLYIFGPVIMAALIVMFVVRAIRGSGQ